MIAQSLKDVVERIQVCIGEGRIAEAEQLLFPALDQMPDTPALWFYAGSLFQTKGQHSLAIECWKKCHEIEPNPLVFVNLGAAYRTMNRIDECRSILQHGLTYLPDDAQLLTNLCGSYVNEGNPGPGIEAGEKALANGADNRATFNLGLLYLENGEYGKGFDHYSEGKHQHREERSYGPDDQLPLLSPQLHKELKGRDKTILIYGEQGLGDEIMFSTVLKNVVEDYDIIFDSHPRLELLHKTSMWARLGRARFSKVRITPTRKTQEPDIDLSGVAAKVAIGDLCRLYRRDRADFYWEGPTLFAPEKETQEMRAQLELLANGRKIIGLATRGGTISTNTKYRRLPQEVIESLLAREDCYFVGLDYEDMTELSMWAQNKYGDRYMWSAAVNFHWDIHHLAALIAATDTVITPCQTVAHLSAALGHSTHVLVPHKTAWRYGLTGSQWAWYPGDHAVLHRQTDSWDSALTQIHGALDGIQQQRVAA